jgi:hypothetical protein
MIMAFAGVAAGVNTKKKDFEKEFSSILRYNELIV